MASPGWLLETLRAARRERGWSQAELGSRVGLPQAHVSGIETGKVVPRFDTLLELARILGLELMIVPRPLVPAVDSLVRDYRRSGEPESALYAVRDGDAEEGDDA